MAARAINVIRHTVAELRALRGPLNSKPPVSSLGTVWETVKYLNIAWRYRGCRAGVNKQRQIHPIIGNRPQRYNDSILQGYDNSSGNLVTVPITSNVITCTPSSKMRFGCINARSVRNKAMAVSDFVVEKKTLMCARLQKHGWTRILLIRSSVVSLPPVDIN